MRLFRQVCEAVQYAHGQEIIHRDLKPSNILVEPDGTPRLLDFGIARELQTLDEFTDQTRQGLRFMTPDYAAPESIRDGTVGFYTDVYSLGVILYEMLIQVKPSDEAGKYVLRKSLTALSVAEYYAGHYQTAESVGRRAVALDRQLLGTLHPKTGSDLMNLGTTEAALGEYTEAESLYREGVHIIEAWYGPNHPDTATSMAILASTLIQEGKYTEAESLLNQVLKIQERMYGSVHDRIAFTLDMLGRTAMKRGDPASAQADFSRAVAIDHLLLGDKSPRTAAIKVDLADAYIQQAKYAEAEDILRKAVNTLVQSLPAGDAHIGSAYASLGRTLLNLRRYREAETQLTAGYEILEKQPRPPVARIQEVRRDLVTVYDALDEPDKAKQFRTERSGSYAAVAKVANIR